MAGAKASAGNFQKRTQPSQMALWSAPKAPLCTAATASSKWARATSAMGPAGTPGTSAHERCKYTGAPEVVED